MLDHTHIWYHSGSTPALQLTLVLLTETDYYIGMALNCGLQNNQRGGENEETFLPCKHCVTMAKTTTI